MNKSLTRILLLGALISAALFSSCQKDGVVTLRARIGHFGSQDKVFIGGEDNLTPYWRNGDTVIVNGTPCTLAGSTTETRLEVARAASYWAVFPATINPVASQTDSRINVTLPALQPYWVTSDSKQAVNAPMGAYLESDASSGSITFTNMGALLAINIVNHTGHTAITVDSVSVRATGIPLWGDGYVADYDKDSRHVVLTSNLQDHDSVVLARPNPELLTNPHANRSLSMGLTVTDSKEVYVYVPSCEPLTPNRYRIIIHAHHGSEDVSESNEQSESNPYAGCIPNNNLALVNFPVGHSEIEYPEGAVHGVFTVGQGKQVYFSNGNLQYQASTGTTGTWRFAENQWDFVGGNTVPGTVTGSSNNRIGANGYTGWIDLFGWGTSGYNGYQPIRSANDNTLYPDLPGLVGPNANYDWGHYNPIANGGNQAHLWRTLTMQEWRYLLETRTFAGDHSGEGYSYKLVTLNVSNSRSVRGILLFPDGYSDQSQVANTTNNTITTIPDNCVFLPSQGGYRQGQSEPANYSLGYYWTATRYSGVNIYYVKISGSGVTYASIAKSTGLSVRLVQNVN